jgi:osmotically inducible protein OsmC
MPSRTARTAWNGTLQEGSGQVEPYSSEAGTFDVSFPDRAADEAGGTTSPEERIAAGSEQAAQAAEAGCPVSKAPAGVGGTTLDAALDR